jgi:hypothetical protein
MWDINNERLFERTRPNDSDSSYTIRALSNEDLMLAVDQFMMFKTNGNWPIEDTVINRIWEKHKSELGDNSYHGRYRAYDLICHEIAKRWYKNQICDDNI